MKKILLLIAIMFTAQYSAAVGIGSTNWGGSHPSGGDPIGGILLILACLFVLGTAWTNGKSSIKTIYLPTLIGGFVLFLIIDKLTFKALFGYIVIGFFLGQIFRLFFGHYFDENVSNQKDGHQENSAGDDGNLPKKGIEGRSPIKSKRLDTIDETVAMRETEDRSADSVKKTVDQPKIKCPACASLFEFKEVVEYSGGGFRCPKCRQSILWSSH